ILALPALLTLQGCSWIQSWGEDKDDPNAPSELVEFNPTLTVNRLWSQDVGVGIGRQKAQLRPAHDSGTIYTADFEGRLFAVDAQSGRILWERETELPFSGGPGVSGDLVMLGTEDGRVHAFGRSGGQPFWSADVSSEVLATPLEQDGIVVVRCVDGRVFGLNADTGRRIWIYDHAVPLLTLRGNSVPLIRAGVVFIGYDGGEVVALNLDDGSLIWEQAVVTSEGRSELERLADIDGQMVFIASDLIVSSYKNRLASLAADSGRLLWFKEISSATGLTVDRTNLAVSDRNDSVWLLDRRNGSTIWKQEQLAHRALTRPAIQGGFVVVGDFEGYVHWLGISDGQFAARVEAGGDGFAAAPLVVGSALYLLTRDGDLVAYSVGGSS
nr:outer membrane protein assembly factor BamB [Xanthomonadales bacterium]NIX12232.1 outer membrane protein assembly factor BamB [Xanthomonadales bacterium]